MLIVLLFTFAHSLLITGCWNRREIDELGIVVAAAVDKLPQTEGKPKRKKRGNDSQNITHGLELTYQFVIPKRLGSTSDGQGSSKAYYNLSSRAGKTINQSIRDQSTEISRRPFVDHLKVIIISDEVAKSHDLEKLMDYYFRDNDIRRTVRVLVSHNNAREILDKPSILEDLPAFKLFSLTDNEERSTKIASKMTLGKMSEKMSGDSSFLIQRVMITNNQKIKLSGSAVIKGKSKKLIGWLNEQETDGVNWMMENVKHGIAEGVVEKKQAAVAYEIRKVKSTIKSRVKGGQIAFTVDVESEGRLGENWGKPEDAFTDKYIEKLEKAIEQSITNSIQKAMKKLQSELKSDVVGFGTHVKIDHPKIWKKVKDDWEEHFSRIPVDVNAHVTIVDYGDYGKK